MTGARNTNVNVKIGGLWKRSQNLSKLTTPNYKHRVFILTNHSLCYYKGTIDVSFTCAGRYNCNAAGPHTYVHRWMYRIVTMNGSLSPFLYMGIYDPMVHVVHLRTVSYICSCYPCIVCVPLKYGYQV